MDKATAKEIGYTHKGWMYLFIPVYMDEVTTEVIGRNWVADKMIDAIISIDVFSEQWAIIVTGEL